MNRRGFLRGLFGAVAGVALGGSGKVISALTTPKVAAAVVPSCWEAGYFFAPYIPLQVTPTFLNPADYRMSKGRYTGVLTLLEPKPIGESITDDGMACRQRRVR